VTLNIGRSGRRRRVRRHFAALPSESVHADEFRTLPSHEDIHPFYSTTLQRGARSRAAGAPLAEVEVEKIRVFVRLVGVRRSADALHRRLLVRPARLLSVSILPYFFDFCQR